MTKKIGNAPQVTATQLLKDYKADPAKADKEYKGKLIKVKGKVEATSPLTLKGDDDLGVVTVNQALKADFNDAAKGSEITVGGMCMGKNPKLTISDAWPVKK